MPTQQKQFPLTSAVIAVLKIQMADAMAASSGGLEWSVIIKSFLSPQEESCNKVELLDLCSAIVKRYDGPSKKSIRRVFFFVSNLSPPRNIRDNSLRCDTRTIATNFRFFSTRYSETEILRHKESNKAFYNSFAVLAADHISNNASHREYPANKRNHH